MSKQDIYKRIFWLSGLLTLIIGLLIHILSWIKDDHYECVGKVIGYKILVSSVVLLFLMLVGAILYHLIFPKTKTPKTQKQKATQPKKKHLRRIPRDERCVLKPYIMEQKTTIEFYSNNSVLDDLLHKNILKLIHLSPEVRTDRNIGTYRINIFARQYFEKHPHVLKIKRATFKASHKEK